uniref:Uncharacterized protein n=1 Tax=Ciona savignyi TaxID=51511 RepID=H2YIY0_CIOSA
MFSCPQGNEVARNNASAVDNMSNQVDLVRDIEIDGRIFEQLKDPPGQKSQYILPGDTEREIYRLTTYIKFPLNSPVDVVLLAKFGFFYTGCGMNIESWSVGDDPTMDSWHFSACALVCGTEERNVPVTSFMGNPQKLKFTRDPRSTRPPIDIADPG